MTVELFCVCELWNSPETQHYKWARIMLTINAYILEQKNQVYSLPVNISFCL